MQTVTIGTLDIQSAHLYPETSHTACDLSPSGLGQPNNFQDVFLH